MADGAALMARVGVRSLVRSLVWNSAVARSAEMTGVDAAATAHLPVNRDVGGSPEGSSSLGGRGRR